MCLFLEKTQDAVFGLPPERAAKKSKKTFTLCIKYSTIYFLYKIERIRVKIWQLIFPAP